MAEHLSDLRLDEIAAGMPVSGEARAHAEACPECGVRLREIDAARKSARGSHGYHRVQARLKAPEPRRWRWFALAIPAAVAAMVVAVVVARVEEPREPGVRLKGGYAVALLAGNGSEVERARAGERLTLAVGAAGRAEALVLAVDEGGAVEVLWPVGGVRSAPVPSGARAKLEPSFEVTPGAIAVHALFANGAIEAGAAKAALEAEVEAARRGGRTPLDARSPAGPWEGAARVVLQVAP